VAACCHGKRDDRAAIASFESEVPPGLNVPRMTPVATPPPAPAATLACPETQDANTPADPNPKAKAKTKTKHWAFDISIGGASPLRIKGSVTSEEEEAATMGTP
jgi:hypothetical protein